MSERRDDLMDEAVLRRALRLESDETAPRFDARAIALMASRPAWSRRTASFALVAAIAFGVAAGAIWSSIFAAGPTLVEAGLAAVVELSVAVASVLLPLAQIAQQPAIPLSLIAALGVATFHELRERRERRHANPS